MSMYQIEDFVEKSIAHDAQSTLTQQEKRNLIHTLFEMQTYGDCGFTHLRSISALIDAQYTFVFSEDVFHDYQKKFNLNVSAERCYGMGDVYFDQSARNYCIDSGSDAWGKLVAAKVITGEGASEVKILPFVQTMKQVKQLFGEVGPYMRECFLFVAFVVCGLDDIAEADCFELFGATKQEILHSIEY